MSVAQNVFSASAFLLAVRESVLHINLNKRCFLNFTNSVHIISQILFQEPMAGFAKRTRTDRTAAAKCVAIAATKPFKPRSKSAASVNFIGVATLNVKPVWKMSNLQCVNNYEIKTKLSFPFPFYWKVRNVWKKTMKTYWEIKEPFLFFCSFFLSVLLSA